MARAKGSKLLPVRESFSGSSAAALSPAARAGLAGLEVLFETDSTNAEALRQPVPVQGTRAWLAERQTAGRGRRGRRSHLLPRRRHRALTANAELQREEHIDAYMVARADAMPG